MKRTNVVFGGIVVGVDRRIKRSASMGLRQILQSITKSSMKEEITSSLSFSPKEDRHRSILVVFVKIERHAHPWSTFQRLNWRGCARTWMMIA